MRIGIDARPFTKSYKSGIAVYLENLLVHLPKEIQGKEHIIYLYAHKQFSFPKASTNMVLRTGGGHVPGTLWVQARLPWLLAKDSIDVFWGTQHVIPLIKAGRIKMALTIHDLVFKRFPETVEWTNLLINQSLVSSSLKKSDIILAVSHSTTNDLHHFYPRLNKPIEQVLPGVDNTFTRIYKTAAKDYVKSKFGIEQPFILVVGTQEPRKNFITAFRAFNRLASTIPHLLVSVGQMGWKIEHVLQEINGKNLSQRVRFLNYVQAEDLPRLYSAADVFLFPSLYEGFGIPPLEAMACSCPVITSNTSSLPEVVGDAGIQLPPLDVQLWADKLKSVLQDKQLQEKMSQAGLRQAKKFTWERSSAKLWDIFKKLV